MVLHDVVARGQSIQDDPAPPAGARHDKLGQSAALPSDKASVTLTRAVLIALLEDSPSESESITRDLTVEEVAEEVGRAPSTIRAWLLAGELPDYSLNGKSWRIPRSALREYLDSQGRKAATDVRINEDQDVDISAWRKIRDLR